MAMASALTAPLRPRCIDRGESREGGRREAHRKARNRDLKQWSLCDFHQELCVAADRVAAAANNMTTTHGGAFQTVNRRKPPTASAKSRDVRTPLVQMGL